MPTKFSEKKLLFSLVLLATGLFLLFATKLTNAPVRITEKGLFFFLVGITLLVTGIRTLINTAQKV